MAYDTLNTKNVAIITAGTTLAFLGSIGLGVVGNTLAAQATERTTVACVQSGGSWIRVPDIGAFECVR